MKKKTFKNKKIGKKGKKGGKDKGVLSDVSSWQKVKPKVLKRPMACVSDDAVVLGCSKCRYLRNGCKACRPVDFSVKGHKTYHLW